MSPPRCEALMHPACACCSGIGAVHTVHALKVCMLFRQALLLCMLTAPYLCTSCMHGPCANCVCTVPVHTMFAFVLCMLFVHCICAYCECILSCACCLCTVPVHTVCALYLHMHGDANRLLLPCCHSYGCTASATCCLRVVCHAAVRVTNRLQK